MAKYTCTDGNASLEFEADSAQEAAQEYVDGGIWGEEDGTVWVEVWVQEEGADDREQYVITVDPAEPRCVDKDADHDWQSPYEIVGGIKENPGVWGHGGGAIIREVCLRCGCGKTTNTWAQNPLNWRTGPGVHQIRAQQVQR